MGLFRRTRDGDGLYRGDAPVSMPGFDGASPTGYAGPAHVDHSQHYSRGFSPGAAADEAAYADQLPESPMERYSDPQFLRQLNPNRRPETLARRVTTRTLAMMVGVSIFFAFILVSGIDRTPHRSGTVVTSQEVDAALPVPSRTVAATPLGEPTLVETGDGQWEVIVHEAIYQPAGSWLAMTLGEPSVIVDVEVRRTDAGGADATLRIQDWRLIDRTASDPTERIAPSIFVDYYPTVHNVELGAGDAHRGFLAFRTDMKDAVLDFMPRTSQGPQASWELAANLPTAVPGVLGQPIQPEVVRTPFTLTVDGPSVISDGDSALARTPASGQFLTVEISITTTDHTTAYVGAVHPTHFVFRPDEGDPVSAESIAIHDELPLFSLRGGDTADARWAFDTAATSGVLEFRTDDDLTLATWRIDVD